MQYKEGGAKTDMAWKNWKTCYWWCHYTWCCCCTYIGCCWYIGQLNCRHNHWSTIYVESVIKV